MKLLLTSAGIRNASIQNALLELLGKPIAECGLLVDAGGDPGLPGVPHWFFRNPTEGEFVLKVQRKAESTELIELGFKPSSINMIAATRNSAWPRGMRSTSSASARPSVTCSTTVVAV